MKDPVIIWSALAVGELIIIGWLLAIITIRNGQQRPHLFRCGPQIIDLKQIVSAHLYTETPRAVLRVQLAGQISPHNWYGDTAYQVFDYLISTGIVQEEVPVDGLASLDAQTIVDPRFEPASAGGGYG